MELILDLIYIYIAIFSIYYFVLALRSLNEKRLFLDLKYSVNANKSMLCTIIYAHNNYEALKNMIEQLMNQSYPMQNQIIYVILDNCSDHSEDIIPENLNIRVLNLNDGVTVGKDQAIPILLESLRQDTSIDSYVFLDVDRYIENDFLENVNVALNMSPVVSGQTVIIENENLTFSERIVTTYTKYFNHFIRKSRTLFKLSDRIDANLFAIRKDFVEKIDALDIKDVNTELKYSILLSKLGYPCIYVPTIKSYVKSYNYKLVRPSITYRISLFKQCLPQLFTKNFKFIENVFSLIAPSALVTAVLTVFFLCLTFNFYFLFSFTVVFTVFSLLLLGFAISIIKSELFAKDFLYLVLYPFYSVEHILKNLPPVRFIRKYFFKNTPKRDIQKYTVKVLATNGKANIPCKLDLISENGLAKVVFTFKTKKFTSSRQIRMVEALNELTTKLNDYGFQLKICYCCEYFSSIVDGSQNMVKGLCNFQFKNRTEGEELQTILWNSCSACKPKKQISIIEDIRMNQG
ncbi:MAG: glycosyltransferase [Candidatus Gastranaerophilaceae bacterium]